MNTFCDKVAVLRQSAQRQPMVGSRHDLLTALAVSFHSRSLLAHRAFHKFGFHPEENSSLTEPFLSVFQEDASELGTVVANSGLLAVQTSLLDAASLDSFESA